MLYCRKGRRRLHRVCSLLKECETNRTACPLIAMSDNLAPSIILCFDGEMRPIVEQNSENPSEAPSARSLSTADSAAVSGEAALPCPTICRSSANTGKATSRRPTCARPMRPTGSISPPGGGSGLSPLPADPQVVGLYIAACAAEYNTVPNQRAGGNPLQQRLNHRAAAVSAHLNLCSGRGKARSLRPRHRHGASRHSQPARRPVALQEGAPH